MRSHIRPDLLSAYWDPTKAWFHTTPLAPFFAIHASYADARTAGRAHEEPFVWEWDDPRAVTECLQSLWNMTGRWKARRGFTFERADFDERIVAATCTLARKLNRAGVHSLGDLARANAADHRRVALAVQEAVESVSALRATKDVQPVLGSKALHHFFPSVIPVFDTALVRNGVMCTKSFRELARSDRVVLDRASDAGGPAMLEFHQYFAFMVAQIGCTPPRVLAAVRRRFGRAFSRLAPAVDLEREDAPLWRMDAKLAEYCLVGQAKREGLYRRRAD
jgi:hypothetical protein